MLKVNNRNFRKRCEIHSKLTMKAPEWLQWRRSDAFIINFEHILHFLLVFSLLILSMCLFDALCRYFYPISLTLEHLQNSNTTRKNLKTLNIYSKTFFSCLLFQCKRSFFFLITKMFALLQALSEDVFALYILWACCIPIKSFVT